MEIEIITTQNSIENSLDPTREFGLFLTKCLSFIKMTHWYTSNYNAHKILGSLYDDLSNLFDELQEEIIGTSKTRNVIFPKFSFNIQHIEDLSLFNDEDSSILSTYYNVSNEIMNTLTSLEFNTYLTKVKSGVKNTVDAILTRINKTNYLLSIL